MSPISAPLEEILPTLFHNGSIDLIKAEKWREHVKSVQKLIISKYCNGDTEEVQMKALREKIGSENSYLVDKLQDLLLHNELKVNAHW